MGTNRRLMLMIDGDNAEAALLPEVLAEVSKYGVMKIRRVYGNWESLQLKPWKDLLHTYALNPVQLFSYTAGKNATDIALIIDAMDFLHSADVDGICIVSSDSDYTPLATRLREKGLFVMGIGTKGTSPSFVNACDAFVHTETLKTGATPKSGETPKSGKTEAVKPSIRVASITEASASKANVVNINKPVLGKAFKKLIRTAYDSTALDDTWAHLGALGSSLRKLDPNFLPSTYGHKTLSQLVQANPNIFEIQKRNNKSGNADIYVRLKGN